MHGASALAVVAPGSRRPDPGYRVAFTKSEEEIELSNGNCGNFSSYKDAPENVPGDEEPSSKEAEFEGDFIQILLKL